MHLVRVAVKGSSLQAQAAELRFRLNLHLEQAMTHTDEDAMKDPFKLGVLTTLMLVGKTLKADPAISTKGLISETEKLISLFPGGEKPLDEQDQHTIALRWFLSGLHEKDIPKVD